MGFWEFIVIAVVGTIVLGPDKLPGALRKLVEMKRKLSQMTQGLSAEVNEQLRVHELHQNLKEAEKKGMDSLSPELQNSVNELRNAAHSVNPNFENDLSAAEQSTSFKNTEKSNSDPKDSVKRVDGKHND